jgi:hypothetical protein
MKIRFIKKSDIVIIAVLLLIAAALLLPRLLNKSDRLYAQIVKNGEVLQTVDLSQVAESYTLDLGDVKILVEKNAVSFAEADCPDKLCVKCGRLTKSGDTAVCVPTGTVIQVLGSGNDVDVITY